MSVFLRSLLSDLQLSNQFFKILSIRVRLGGGTILCLASSKVSMFFLPAKTRIYAIVGRLIDGSVALP